MNDSHLPFVPRVAFAKVTGAAHSRRTQPCQDAVAGGDSPRAFLVVCDGCGSSAKSEVASQAAVERFRALVAAEESALADLLDAPGETPAEGAARWASLAYAWHGELGALMRSLAHEHGASTDDFLFTWVGVVVGAHRCALVHVGDGAIVGETVPGELRLMSAPYNGVFANSTVFVRPDAPRPGNLRTALHPTPCALALFTDGVEALLLERATMSPSRALAAVFAHARTTAEPDGLSADLAAFLARPDWSEVTGDDRALAVWVRG